MCKNDITTNVTKISPQQLCNWIIFYIQHSLVLQTTELCYHCVAVFHMRVHSMGIVLTEMGVVPRTGGSIHLQSQKTTLYVFQL